jgi:hypothetical protein
VPCLKCGRCLTNVADTMWRCWWCSAPLCLSCGEVVGHCGHPDAERVDRETVEAEIEVRREIAKHLPPAQRRPN